MQTPVYEANKQTGVQERVVYCIATDTVAPDHICEASKRPAERRVCERYFTFTFTWLLPNCKWSEFVPVELIFRSTTYKNHWWQTVVRSDCNAAWSVAHWSPCSDGLRTREVIPIPDSDTNNCDNHDNDNNDSNDNGNNDNGVTGVLPMGNWAGGTSFKLWSLEIQVMTSNFKKWREELWRYAPTKV